ncbi:hypothetical protein QEN19_002558 [Hanseniaspora menglaensis]
MSCKKGSLALIINSNQLDVKVTFSEKSGIPLALLKDLNVINILLDFDLNNPYELDYFLNILYKTFREKVEYTVDINVLFKNCGSEIADNFDKIVNESDHVFVPKNSKKVFNRPVQHYSFLTVDCIPFYDPEAENNVSYNYKSFKVSAVGGTFDHLHDGHKILLALSVFLTSKKLIVGLTGEALLVNKKFKEFLQSFEKRAEKVLEFLHLLDISLKYEILPINDICGPTGYEPNIQALIVSQETMSGGDFINKTRAEKGLSQLAIFVVNILGGEEKLSSTYLRQLESTHK